MVYYEALIALYYRLFWAESSSLACIQGCPDRDASVNVGVGGKNRKGC